MRGKQNGRMNIHRTDLNINTKKKKTNEKPRKEEGYLLLNSKGGSSQ